MKPVTPTPPGHSEPMKKCGARFFPLQASRFSLSPLVVLWIVFFLSFPHHCPGAMMFEDASEVRLANGLKVIMLENHTAPVVCFQVWYRAGAANETTGQTGLAAMVERMMSKGEGAGGGMSLETVRESGGVENGEVSHDYACYYETLPAGRLGGAIRFEADRMRNLKIGQGDLSAEKMAVLAERRTRIGEDPVSFLMEQLYAAAFESEPYRWPVMGWADDIGRLTLEDVDAFYSRYYVPANAFLVVTGDFKKDEVLPRVEEAFGKIPPGRPARHYLIEDPPQQCKRMVIAKRPVRTGRVVVAWHVPNLQRDDGYVLEVIRAVLSCGKSSKLYDDLVRQEGVALDTSAHYDLISRDPGLFYISASFIPEKDPAEIEKAICDELEALGKTPVSPRELQRAQNQLEASFVFEHESILALGKKLAEYEIASDWASISAYIPSIRSITPQDIRRVAAKYFTGQNRTVGVLIPSAPAVEKGAPTGGGTH